MYNINLKSMFPRSIRSRSACGLEKISCSNYGYRQWKLSEVIPSVAKIGYKGIEIVTHGLGWPMGFHLMPEFEEAGYIDAMTDCLGENKIQVVCLSPHTEYGIDNQREHFVDHAKRQIDLAIRVRSPMLRIHATQIRQIPPGVSKKDLLEKLADALGRVCDYAKSSRVKLSIENSHYHLKEVTLHEVLDAVGSDYLGITWHTTADDNPEEIVSTFGNKIWHLHLSEASRIGNIAMRINWMRRRGRSDPDIRKELGLARKAFDEALAYVGRHFFMGKGDVPLKTIAKALKDIHYSGWWNFEGHWTGDPEEDARKGYAYITELLKG